MFLFDSNLLLLLDLSSRLGFYLRGVRLGIDVWNLRSLVFGGLDCRVYRCRDSLRVLELLVGRCACRLRQILGGLRTYLTMGLDLAALTWSLLRLGLPLGACSTLLLCFVLLCLGPQVFLLLSELLQGLPGVVVRPLRLLFVLPERLLLLRFQRPLFLPVFDEVVDLLDLVPGVLHGHQRDGVLLSQVGDHTTGIAALGDGLGREENVHLVDMLHDSRRDLGHLGTLSGRAILAPPVGGDC